MDKRSAAPAGVDSVEHGHGADRQNLEMMKAKGVYWVPTMGYYFNEVERTNSPQARKYMEGVLQRARQNIPIAREVGVKIANGFDPSNAEAHGRNALEIIAMTKLGLSPLEADPTAGQQIQNIQMKDPRWPANQGSVKMRQNINGIEIHYVRNVNTGAVADFKFAQ